jgi:hypothetical protein
MLQLTAIKLFNTNTQYNATYFLMIFVYDMFRKIIFPSSGQFFLNIYARKTTQIAMSIFKFKRSLTDKIKNQKSY